MKKVKIALCIAFFVVILSPIVFFNWEQDYISEIDNKVLMNFPNAENTTGDITTDIETYVNDRIGGREQFIQAYTVLNDRLFDVMVHPTYTYGEDGYIFLKTGRNGEHTEFHTDFAKMAAQIQTYCENRGTEFYLCFNPSKSSVYSQYLPKGLNYDRSWVDQFMEELDSYGVNYVDNTEILIEKSENEVVYNQKYDAGHWNDLGAFYGMNNLFLRIHEDIPEVKPLSKEQFNITSYVQTSLPVSQFEIHEEVPGFDWKGEVADRTAEYVDDVEVDTLYNHFLYWENMEEGKEKLPKILAFQGSYVNGREKFLIGNASEYIAVHNYQNIHNFEYYYDMFEPDCVILEVAEYVLIEGFFSHEKMKTMDLN